MRRWETLAAFKPDEIKRAGRSFTASGGACTTAPLLSVGEGNQLVLSVIFGLSSNGSLNGIKHDKHIMERDTLPSLR